MPSWNPIPTSCYLGSDANAYRNNQFSHESYATWIPADSLAVPNNTWWKEEVFDISNEVNYAQVRFKFTIKKGSVVGTHFAYGWLIDNFKITASVYEIKPPEVAFLTNFTDTVYNTGPFTIRAKVATRTIAPIIQPIKLNVAYTYNNITTYDTLIMTPVQGDSIYSAIIPQKIFGTSIFFSVYGEDTVGNNAYAFAGFVLKRTSAGSTNDSLQIGSLSGGGDCSYPFTVSGDGNNWSRQLYLSSDIGNTSMMKSISGLAYYNSYTGVTITRYNTQCYLKATTLTDVNGSCTYNDPISNGASKVYQGTWTTVNGWNKFVFNVPFLLPPGSNLMVYGIDTSSQNVCNSGGGMIWWTNNAVGYTCTDRQYTNFGCSNTSCGSTSSLPATIVFFGGSVDDSNSVALDGIESRPTCRSRSKHSHCSYY